MGTRVLGRARVSKRDWTKAKRHAETALERAEASQDDYRRMPLHRTGGNCPKCGKTTIERTRRSDGNAFYGCTAYPRCNGAWIPPP